MLLLVQVLFHSFQALGNQAPAPVKPRKGRQNQGEFPPRNLFFRPAGAPAKQRALWTQGWRPGLSSSAPAGLNEDCVLVVVPRAYAAGLNSYAPAGLETEVISINASHDRALCLACRVPSGSSNCRGY